MGLSDQNLHNPVWRFLFQLLCENAHLKEPSGTKTFVIFYEKITGTRRGVLSNTIGGTPLLYEHTLGSSAKQVAFTIFPMIELGF